jgi:hypothetical protein
MYVDKSHKIRLPKTIIAAYITIPELDDTMFKLLRTNALLIVCIRLLHVTIRFAVRWANHKRMLTYKLT